MCAQFLEAAISFAVGCEMLVGAIAPLFLITAAACPSLLMT